MSISTDSPNGSSPTAMWSPTVDLTTARPVVFALARAPQTSGEQSRTAIAELLRLSGELRDVGDVDQRPWIWLRAVAVAAEAGRDQHLAAACLLWAFVWTTDRRQRRREGVASLPAIRLDLKLDILAVGIAALSRLPVDFVIVGTGADAVLAGPLLDRASRML